MLSYGDESQLAVQSARGAFKEQLCSLQDRMKGQ